MVLLREVFIAVQSFMDRGGDVLWAIAAVTFLMWVLILERYWYFRRIHPKLAADVHRQWEARRDQRSWYAQQVRRMLISRVSQELRMSVATIQALVALCPLLGLLGTVTGMIEVFDIMAIAGGGNARAMASGVSKATIPTMAGMVAALSGLYFSTSIERFAREERERVSDQLVHH
ncbi:MAG: MotA/TolQ/ExbB proton channel family protein [Proteobacteria bacterium]|nr:MotA/TolQ/ExbB proton channel family protein [Pseudomonadota bacterium]